MATNFLYYAGSTPFNGLLTTTSVTMISTEMVSLGSSAVAVSAAVLTSSQTGQGIWGDMYLTFGTSTAAPAPGANFAGWFLTSPDGGTTFESTQGFNPGPARSPDFIIPVSTIAIASSAIFRSAGIVRLPALEFKTAVQNNLGITFSTSNAGNPTIKVAPYAMQY